MSRWLTRVSVLGDLQVTVDGADHTPAGAIPRRVVTALASTPGRAVPLDRLIHLAWAGRPPASARNSLQSHVSRLRGRLGADRIVGDHLGYRLDVGEGGLDVAEFERLLDRAAAQAGRPEQAAQHLAAALALWRATPYAELGDDPDVALRVAELEHRRRLARLDLAEARLLAGQHAAASTDLAQFLVEQPLDHRAAALQARALYLAGQQAEALAVLAEHRRATRDELGLDPPAELDELERSLLRRELPTASVSPPGPRPAAPSAFVALAAELAAADELLAAAGGGAGGLLLVSGEPGIGKTRLATEITARAAGFAVAWGRCYDDGRARALAPWREAVDDWLAAASADDAARLGPQWPRAVATLGIAPAAGEPSPDDLGLAAVAEVLHRMAAVRPLLVVLDDLHWGDPASARLVELVSRDIAASPLVVLALFRDGELAGAHPFRGVVGRVRRRDSTRALGLRELDADAVTAYVETRTGAAPPRWLVARLMERTGGNPFYLRETVDLLTERDRLDPSDPWPVPEGAFALTEQRLAGLAPPTADLLRTAALDGTVLDVPLLAAAHDTTPLEVLRLLDDAVPRRLLDADPEHPGRLWFAHDLVREAIVDSLTPATRADRHGRLGAVLAERADQHDEAALGRAVRHLLPASIAAPDLAATAGRLSAAASRLALARGDVDEALRHQRAALQAAGSASLPPAELLALRLELAELTHRAGRLDEVDYPRLADAAHGVAPEVEARAALGHEHWSVDARRPRTGTDDASVVLLRRALTHDHPPDLRAALLGALAQALAFAGSLDQARLVAGRAEAATDAASDRVRAETLTTVATVLDRPADLATRVRLLETATALTEQADGELVGADLVARRRLVPDLIRLGRLTDADLAIDDLLVRAEAAGSEIDRWHVPLWRAVLSLGRGRLAEAELLVERFRVVATHHGYADTDRVHGVLSALLHLEQGAPQAAREVVELRAADDRFEPWDWTRLLTDWAAGHRDLAAERLVDLSARRFRPSPPFAGIEVFLGCLVAAPVADLGEATHAAELARIIAPARGQNVVLGAGAALLGSASHHLGVLALRSGDADTARELLGEALRQQRAWGLRPAAERTAALLRAQEPR